VSESQLAQRGSEATRAHHIYDTALASKNNTRTSAHSYSIPSLLRRQASRRCSQTHDAALHGKSLAVFVRRESAVAWACLVMPLCAASLIEQLKSC
jgi:hypothetical protein